MDESGYGRLDSRRATRLCRETFLSRGFDVDRLGELSVALVDLERMQDLNFTFRDMEAPTDVLSFTVDGPYGEMVGEIVVAPGYVDGEEAEIEELVVHGALHLCGMDHGEDFEASEMSRAQRAVLEKVREEG